MFFWMSIIILVHQYLYRSVFNRDNGKSVLVRKVSIDLKRFEKGLRMLHDGVLMINSIFTFHLIGIVINAVMIEIFTYYAILWEILNHSNLIFFGFIQNGSWALTMMIIKLASTHAGSSIKKNGEETAVIITQILSESYINEDLAVSLQNLMLRISIRNFELKTPLFSVTYKLIVSVKKIKPETKLSFYGFSLFLDDFNYHDLSSHHWTIRSIKNSRAEVL